MRSIPASLIDKLSKFYHFKDGMEIEHISSTLDLLIKQAGKILSITSTHLHTPDTTETTRIAYNSPACLLYSASETPDYFYTINKYLRFDDIQVDALERELGRLLTEMGKTYKQLLNKLGFHIV